jgi:hypothetical protein
MSKKNEMKGQLHLKIYSYHLVFLYLILSPIHLQFIAGRFVKSIFTIYLDTVYI